MKKTLFITLFFFIIPVVLNAQIKIKASSAIHDVDGKFVACDDEVDATFPGGISKFNEYLAKNIHFPVHEAKYHIHGKVFLTFIIDNDGSINNVKVIRGVSKDIDAEAVRVLSNSPKWNPTRMCGKAVKTQYSIPVNFSLDK